MMRHAANEIRNNPGTAALAAYGAAEGLYKYGLRPHLTAKRGWAAIGLGVLAYELACPAGETLSEGVDKALESKRLLTVGAIGITALHLMNALPEKIDPFSQALKHLKLAVR